MFTHRKKASLVPLLHKRTTYIHTTLKPSKKACRCWIVIFNHKKPHARVSLHSDRSSYISPILGARTSGTLTALRRPWWRHRSEFRCGRGRRTCLSPLLGCELKLVQPGSAGRRRGLSGCPDSPMTCQASPAQPVVMEDKREMCRCAVNTRVCRWDAVFEYEAEPICKCHEGMRLQCGSEARSFTGNVDVNTSNHFRSLSSAANRFSNSTGFILHENRAHGKCVSETFYKCSDVNQNYWKVCWLPTHNWNTRLHADYQIEITLN